MPSLVSGYEYDIFISYRHKDNRYDGWVTEFVSNLTKELEATFKDDVSIYFDENPHDGILESHVVSDSLREKLKCVIFIPIVSHTYCDPKSFAWQHELIAFNRFAQEDPIGKNIKLRNGNYASRILPVQIHELEAEDKNLFEKEIGPLRSIRFIFKSAGVNRPLREIDDEDVHEASYRNQINKVANAVKEIISASHSKHDRYTPSKLESEKVPADKIRRKNLFLSAGALLGLLGLATYLLPEGTFIKGEKNPAVAILPFINNTGSGEMDYYGIGMASEIRTKLSMSRQFSFISSMQATLKYANTTMSTREIGEELGVDYILTGLIQKSGNRIKVETELVNAQNGRVIWALPFERESEDLFAIQAEIAASVLEQFSDSPSALKASVATDNITAYAHYMKGNHLLESAFGDSTDFKDSYRPVIEQYEKAIQHDSSFVDAWANLIGVETFVFMNNQDDETHKQKIQKYYDHFNARFEDPLARKLVQGHYSFRVSKEYDQALKLMLEVLEADPENIHATYAVSSLYRRKLDLVNALKYAHKLVQINPSHAGNWMNLATIFSIMGKSAKAYAAAVRGWNLSHSKPHGNDVIMLAIEAGKPLADLPDDVKQALPFETDLFLHASKRQWREAKAVCLKKQKYAQLASACFELDENDSAIYYWEKLPAEEKAKDSISFYIYKKDRNNAIAHFNKKFRQHEYKSAFQNIEKASADFQEIDVMANLRMYEEATEKLRSLAKEFPQFRVDPVFANFPFYDRIKRDHPPFKALIDSLISVKSQGLSEVADI